MIGNRVSGGFGVVGVSCLLLSLAMAVVPSTPVDAQGELSAQAVPASSVVASGDVISIAVLAHPEFSIAANRVQSDGSIPYFFGSLRVVGLTTEAVGKLVADVLVKQKQLAKPVVVVGVVSREPREVNVYGPVRVPGKVTLRENARVLDVVALAGGLLSDRREFVRLTIYRTDGTSLNVDLAKLYAGDLEQNQVVRAGDNLVFQELDPTQTVVRVVGEVRNPTSIPVPTDGSVVALLNAAGGVTAGASLSKAVILRGTQAIEVDLRRFLVDGRLPETAKLKAGDTLVIPVNRNTYRITGAAGKTGDFPYPDDKQVTLSDALSNASLPVQGVNLRKVRVIQKDASGLEKVSVVDAEKLLRGDTANNVVLKPGDSIYVPAAPPRRPLTIQDITFGVSALVGIGRLLGILR